MSEELGLLETMLAEIRQVKADQAEKHELLASRLDATNDRINDTNDRINDANLRISEVMVRISDGRTATETQLNNLDARISGQQAELLNHRRTGNGAREDESKKRGMLFAITGIATAIATATAAAIKAIFFGGIKP